MKVAIETDQSWHLSMDRARPIEREPVGLLFREGEEAGVVVPVHPGQSSMIMVPSMLGI